MAQGVHNSMPLSEICGPLDAAIYETVNGYVDPVTKHRGATALAPRCGMQPNTLSNKANPHCEHRLRIDESIPVQLISGNFSILHAYAAALGHCAVKMPSAAPEASDVALLDTYCQLHAELGEFAERLRDALADGKVTRDEIDQLRTAFDESMRAGLGVLARMQALIHD